MKIIKEGDPGKKIQEMEMTCNNCGCVFTFTPMDLIQTVSFYGYPRHDLHCPYCGCYVAPNEEVEVKDGN